MAQAQRPARRFDIDVLRCMSILFVVMYHAGIPGYYPAPYSGVSVWLRSFMACCVPIFFFTSGVLNAQKERPVGHWVKKAFSCIALCLVWGLVAGAFFQMGDDQPFSVQAMFDACLTVKDRTSWLWFLRAMSVVYFVAPVVICVQRAARESTAGERLWKAVVALGLVCSIGFDTVGSLCQAYANITGSQVPAMVFAWLGGFFPLQWDRRFALGYFICGLWFGERDRRHLLERVPSLVLLAGALLLPFLHFVATFLWYDPTGMETDVMLSGYSTPGTLGLVICLYELFRRTFGVADSVHPAHSVEPQAAHQSLVARLVSLVGSQTGAIYLLHWFVVTPHGAWFDSIAGFWPHLLVGTAVCVVVIFVCAFIGWIIGKTPARYLLRI